MVKNKLKIRTGPMFSGKTEFLIKKFKKYSSFSSLYITHKSDTRGDPTKGYSTHAVDVEMPESVKRVKTLNLKDFFISLSEKKVERVTININDYDIIGIDEAQFFDKNIIDFVKYLVDTLKKYVMVVGLDGDFKREKFGNTLELITLSDSMKKLYAQCSICGNKAVFTERFSPGEEQVLIGGKEAYQPLCRKCYTTRNS